MHAGKPRPSRSSETDITTPTNIRTALNRDIARDLGVSIDLCDDTTMLTSDTLDGYKMLIVHRDGMIWPGGYPVRQVSPASRRSSASPSLPADRTSRSGGSNPNRARPSASSSTTGGSALFLHQRHTRRVNRSGLPPCSRRGLPRPPAHPPLQGQGEELKTPDHQGRQTISSSPMSSITWSTTRTRNTSCLSP